MPESQAEWGKVYTKWHKDASAMCSERRWVECLGHSSLCHYKPGMWVLEGVWRVNNFLHDRRVDASKAKAISRLLVGGQGLRGGDVCKDTPVTVHNCCVWCLREGSKVVESLEHVVFECPAYIGLRSSPRMQALLATGREEIFILHRGQWGWKQMRVLRTFYLDLLAARHLANGGCKSKPSILQQMAEELWF